MKVAMATTLLTSVASAALAEEIKLGVFFGFTGPIESIVADMGPAAELAIKEVSDSGALLNGTTVKAVRGDTTCTDAAVATAAAERLITSEGVKALVGGDCSGVTTAALQNVALPNGTVMISPSATSPALSTVEDKGLFFRTAPSDARQGQIVTDILMEKGVKEIALTYTNNDYGKGLADSIETNYKAAGGKVTIVAAHEDGKGDYSAEVGALASAGGEVLVVAGYIDQGGKGIIQGSLDSGTFDTFYLPDGMVGDTLPVAIGPDLNGSYGANPGTDSPGAATFAKMAEAAGFKAGPFSAEAYDAAALIMLAMQAAKSPESSALKDKVMDVANAPGEKIYPGELAKALKILADGGEVDYVGASAVELIGAGESAGNYRQIEIADGAVKAVKYR
ncbi:MAG: ABC transporter substrate-binding protein [Rhizobiaceae bacterium]|nr:ABC transporter substrate-binding protein [Rhizobiaceae bacterium]